MPLIKQITVSTSSQELVSKQVQYCVWAVPEAKIRSKNYLPQNYFWVVFFFVSCN